MTEPAAQPPPAAPAENKPIDGIALFTEVALERLENLLEWLLVRLRRYRARRGNWWE
ncbi:MAG: hypothetical protein QOH83_425 [Solirubrobacteraceae bacterium]|nr:hypothetical protein [Solirubrobacteraceae bacterium]